MFFCSIMHWENPDRLSPQRGPLLWCSENGRGARDGCRRASGMGRPGRWRPLLWCQSNQTRQRHRLHHLRHSELLWCGDNSSEGTRFTSRLHPKPFHPALNYFTPQYFIFVYLGFVSLHMSLMIAWLLLIRSMWISISYYTNIPLPLSWRVPVRLGEFSEKPLKIMQCGPPIWEQGKPDRQDQSVIVFCRSQPSFKSCQWPAN